MSGYRQFNRAYELQIGELFVRNLDIDFTAIRTLSTTPNSLELVIYNLNPEWRAAFTKDQNQVVQLSAGYEGNTGVIYLGEARTITSQPDGPTWTTSVSSGDGERSSGNSRIKKSFAPGVSYETVVLEVAKSFGDIGMGNLAKMLKKGRLPHGANSYPCGKTVSGSSKKALRQLMLASGLEWSIQNQQFQVLEANKSLSEIAFTLSPDSGLVGCPVLSNNGELSCRALLNAAIVPGRQIFIETDNLEGYFRVEDCKYTGSTTGTDWFVDIEGVQI